MRNGEKGCAIAAPEDNVLASVVQRMRDVRLLTNRMERPAQAILMAPIIDPRSIR